MVLAMQPFGRNNPWMSIKTTLITMVRTAHIINIIINTGRGVAHTTRAADPIVDK